MTRALLFACLSLAAFFVTVPASAERLVSQISNDHVEITSSFDGERLSIFGSIEPDIGAENRTVAGPFHIVVVVTGPTQHRVVREKTSLWGIWLNTGQVEFANFPNYFQVLSSGRLTDVADKATLAENAIAPEAQLHPAEGVSASRASAFGAQLLRKMTEMGLYGVQENGVGFFSETFYSARLTLPSSAPPGPYIAQTYLLKDGAVIARTTIGFAVRKIGFERFMALSSVQFPLLYGLACVALALFTGWLGGVVFRR